MKKYCHNYYFKHNLKIRLYIKVRKISNFFLQVLEKKIRSPPSNLFFKIGGGKD